MRDKEGASILERICCLASDSIACCQSPQTSNEAFLHTVLWNALSWCICEREQAGSGTYLICCSLAVMLITNGVLTSMLALNTRNSNVQSKSREQRSAIRSTKDNVLRCKWQRNVDPSLLLVYAKPAFLGAQETSHN